MRVYPEFLACRAALREQGADFVSSRTFRDSEVRAGGRFFRGARRAAHYIRGGRRRARRAPHPRREQLRFVSPPDHARRSNTAVRRRGRRGPRARRRRRSASTHASTAALARVLGDARARVFEEGRAGVGGDRHPGVSPVVFGVLYSGVLRRGARPGGGGS